MIFKNEEFIAFDEPRFVKLLRGQDHVASTASLQFSPRGLEDHQSKLALVRQRFGRLDQVDRFAGKIATQVKAADPLAGRLVRIFPAQLLIGSRLVA